MCTCTVVLLQSGKLALMLSTFALQLSFDLLEGWLRKHPEALMASEQNLFKELALYQDYHGLEAFRKVTDRLSNFHWPTLLIIFFLDDCQIVEKFTVLIEL